MARISKKERIEQIQEQVMDITMRIEYLAEKEPMLLNYIQRTIEGLCIVDNETIKIENSKKLLIFKTINKLKIKKHLNWIYCMANECDKLEPKNK